jgi:hypothetical protein
LLYWLSGIRDGVTDKPYNVGCLLMRAWKSGSLQKVTEPSAIDRWHHSSDVKGNSKMVRQRCPLDRRKSIRIIPQLWESAMSDPELTAHGTSEDRTVETRIRLDFFAISTVDASAGRADHCFFHRL